MQKVVAMLKNNKFAAQTWHMMDWTISNIPLWLKNQQLSYRLHGPCRIHFVTEMTEKRQIALCKMSGFFFSTQWRDLFFSFRTTYRMPAACRYNTSTVDCHFERQNEVVTLFRLWFMDLFCVSLWPNTVGIQRTTCFSFYWLKKSAGWYRYVQSLARKLTQPIHIWYVF